MYACVCVRVWCVCSCVFLCTCVLRRVGHVLNRCVSHSLASQLNQETRAKLNWRNQFSGGIRKRIFLQLCAHHVARSNTSSFSSFGQIKNGFRGHKQSETSNYLMQNSNYLFIYLFFKLVTCI